MAMPQVGRALGITEGQQIANDLRAQVAAGRMTPEQANFQLYSYGLQNEAFKLQQQVASGAMSPAQAEAQYAQLQTLPMTQIIDQNIAAAPIQSAYNQSVNKAGTLTEGTKLGQVREINAAALGAAPTVDTAQIGPTALATARNIGAINTVNAPALGGPAQAAGTTIDPATQVGVGDSAFRANQQALAAQLEAQAAGNGPSLANLTLQQSLERALKNQMGALSAQPGVSQALAARLFGQQAGAAQNEAAMSGAQARVAEQIAARQQLQGVYESGRAGDIQVQQGNQAAQQATALAQSQLDAAQEQFNAGLISQRQLEQAQFQYNAAVQNAQAANQRQAEQADIGTRVDLSNQLAQNTNAYNQAQLASQANTVNAEMKYKTGVQQASFNQDAALANQNAFNQSNIAQGQIAGGISEAAKSAAGQVGAARAAASAAVQAANINAEASTTNTILSNTLGNQGSVNPAVTASDEKAKKNVKDGGDEARGMMDKLAAAIFDYKSSKDGKGKQVGVMAQDLEKSDLGEQMVEEKGGKKFINFAKGLGAVLAAQADLNKRLATLEGRK